MGPSNKREYLKQLVEGKNKWFPPLSEEDRLNGFLGWHERGYLPHCDYPGLVQLVTFRLCDSMPLSKRGEWEHLLSIEDPGKKRAQLEDYLDRGLGECWLRDPRIARIMEAALLHFTASRYELMSWVIMPNHVHVLVRVWNTPLFKLVQSWKSYVAAKANSLLHREGQFWEPEYWDTFMRNEEQERRAVNYIERNPVKAKLCIFGKEWPFGSGRFRDVQPAKLIIPRNSGAQSSSSAA